ncbi:MAG: acyltransferase [Chloroflexi bacterium]|nr:acyltransferase [Chloroflexota bacterium]
MLHREDNPRLRKNNFDLLRLVFAATVVFVHTYELSRYEPLSWIPQIFSSDVAVKSFFVVSGFLIFMSYERSSSLASYASKRARRIYPAYFTVILLAAFGLVFVSAKSAGEYFSLEWVKYLAANLAFLNFLQPTLPGVFELNRYTAVNGALWTLKVEVMFYISVPVFVYLFRKFSEGKILALTYFLSVTYAMLMAWLAARTGDNLYAELGHQLPGQLAYFMAGAFFYYYLPFFEKNAGIFLGAGILILFADYFYPLPFLEPFALAALVVFFGLFLYVGKFGKYGDFSYGIYILHFPIIQIFLQYGWLSESPWLYFAAVLSLTLAAGFAMWHLVEKRFLLRSSHYLAETSR